ncbi:MAG: hypothetical protein GC168_11880 [Candidatus Hydrogenedens sp.]|nr:hypothetical protein [Candidatus Hydrogenedens sp.]
MLAVILACTAFGARAEDVPPAPAAPVLSVTLEPSEIPYHRTASYTLRVETAPDDNIAFPELKSVEPDLTVRKGDVRETRTEDRAILEQEYILDAVRPGVYFLPAQEMTIEGSTPLSIPALALRVRDLSEDEVASAQDFAEMPLPDALEQPKSLPSWAWASIAAALLALACGLFWWWNRRQPAPALPPVPAWEVALRRLKELESRKLPAKGRYETFYVDLSSILRYYIEDRFRIRAPEQTTPEFLDSARGSGALSIDQQDVLSKLLRHCDRVKFARYEPALEEMDESMTVVRGFVEETIPRPEPETQEKAA